MAMSEHNHDQKFDRLIRRALIPKGHRPRTEEEIDAMLDALAPSEVSQEKVNRMLAKVRGEEPMGENDECIDYGSEPVERLQEFAAMYRAKEQSLPPELEAILREMEGRAAKPAKDTENGTSE